MRSIDDQVPGEQGQAQALPVLGKEAESESPAAGPKQPERSCLGCRARKKQRELRRLALDPDSSRPRVLWDPDRRLGGRGAWLCRDQAECLNLAIKKRAWHRAFRLQAEPDLTEIMTGLVSHEKK